MRSQLIQKYCCPCFNKNAFSMLDGSLIAPALIEPFINPPRLAKYYSRYGRELSSAHGPGQVMTHKPSLFSLLNGLVPCITALFSPFTLNFSSVQVHGTKSRLLIRRAGSPRAVIGGEFVTWRRRDQWESRSGVSTVEGDQLSRLRLFGYLPQKLNLKYEMYICSSCIWGRGTHRGSWHFWTWWDNPEHVAK